jgi:hypothetical protein
LTSTKKDIHRRNPLTARRVLEGRLLTLVGKHRDVFDITNAEWGGVALSGQGACTRSGGSAS